MDEAKGDKSDLEKQAVVIKDEDSVKKSDKVAKNFEEVKDSKMINEEEEDLPENFFDDFSNKDFMAGLDIVDDWIEEDDIEIPKQDTYFSDDINRRERSLSRKHEPRHDYKKETRSRYNDREYLHRRDRYSRGRHRDRRSRDREFDRRRSRSRHREERRSRDRNRSHERSRRSPKHVAPPEKSSEENDARRDPEKTKRDIQRDKIRCAKDFEARVFQEQIKVVESGLAPPGTEMDVVLEQEKKKQEEEQIIAQEKSQERRKETERLPEKKPTKSHSKSRSRYSRLSPDYRHRKRDYNRSPSPRYHRRSRSLNREEMYRRNDDLRLRLREKRRERYFSELSPFSEVRVSRSPSLANLSMGSNASDREIWLRNRERNRSRYGRSCSPISSSSLSELGSPRRKRSKKTSFMEEIEEKLRQNKKMTPPQPVPFPQQFVQSAPVGFQPQIFPQNFPQQEHSGMLMHQQMPGIPSLMSLQPAPMNVMDSAGILGPQGMMQMMNLPMQIQQPQVLDSSSHMDTSLHWPASNLKPCVSNSNQDVTKLFEEQKISLSDYLSVSAKPIDTKTPPISIHKKIKVISQCQDVIRVLKEDTKLCGRFFPKPSPPELEKLQEFNIRWKSPLRKTLPVRFLFTTPCKKYSGNQDFVRSIINKLLFVTGISNLHEKKQVSSVASNSIQSNKHKPAVKVAPAPISFSVSQQKPKNSPLPQQSVLIKRSSIALQTDPIKCQICEIRNAREFNDQIIQTLEKEVKDQTTQVSMEDLAKSSVMFTPRGILKSTSSVQSLSHLTPAQLLALQQESGNDGWNTARNEPFSMSSRPVQDQFIKYPTRNLSASSSSYNPNLASVPSYRISGNPSGFPTSYSGNADNFSFNSGSNRPFNSTLQSRNIDNYPRYSNDRYSPEQSFDESMNYNVRNVGSGRSGGSTNLDFYSDNYGSQNRPF